jgi:hypothetical protein
MKAERKKKSGRAGETRFVVAALERSESVGARQTKLSLRSNAATARERSLHKGRSRCRSEVQEVAA